MNRAPSSFTARPAGPLDLWQGGHGHVFGSRHPAAELEQGAATAIISALAVPTNCVRRRAENALLATTGGKALRAKFYAGAPAVAVEHAITAARRRTRRSVTFALVNGDHGATCDASRISGTCVGRADLGRRNACYLPEPSCGACAYGRTPDNCELECLADLEYLFDAHFGDVAAVILAPAFRLGGIHVPPVRYFQRLRSFCDAFGVLLILDEARYGLGWLGSLSPMALLGIVPDISVHGPALGGGPSLSALVSYREAADLDAADAREEWEPTALSLILAATALERLLDPDISNAMVHVATTLERLSRSLVTASSVARCSGLGLSWAISSVTPAADHASQIVETMREAGLAAGLSEAADCRRDVLLRVPVTLQQNELDGLVSIIHSNFDMRSESARA